MKDTFTGEYVFYLCESVEILTNLNHHMKKARWHTLRGEESMAQVNIRQARMYANKLAAELRTVIYSDKVDAGSENE